MSHQHGMSDPPPPNVLGVSDGWNAKQLVFHVLEVPVKQEEQRKEATSYFLTVDPLTFQPHSTCVLCQSNPAFRRTGYAVSRLLITRTYSGGRTFNFSEIIGNGAGAGVSDLYYPARERTWTKNGQKWLTQIAFDGVFNVLKEFWPDIDRTVFRGCYEYHPAH